MGILIGLPRQEALSLGLLVTHLEPVTRCHSASSRSQKSIPLLGHPDKYWQGNVAAKCSSSPAHSQIAQDFSPEKLLSWWTLRSWGAWLGWLCRLVEECSLRDLHNADVCLTTHVPTFRINLSSRPSMANSEPASQLARIHWQEER